MSGAPQVIVTLNPASGKLQFELPSANGYRRKIIVKHSFLRAKDEALGEYVSGYTINGNEAAALNDLQILTSILQAQSFGDVAIGTDGAPTEKQVYHWENHGIWASDTCTFCRAEGRASGNTAARKPRPSEILDVRIRELDKKGATDAMYRALLPRSVPPLAAKRGELRAETWRDRATIRRQQFQLRESGVAAERRAQHLPAHLRAKVTLAEADLELVL